MRHMANTGEIAAALQRDRTDSGPSQNRVSTESRPTYTGPDSVSYRFWLSSIKLVYLTWGADVLRRSCV